MDIEVSGGDLRSDGHGYRFTVTIVDDYTDQIEIIPFFTGIIYLFSLDKGGIDPLLEIQKPAFLNRKHVI